jgi:hypothetical protein
MESFLSTTILNLAQSLRRPQLTVRHVLTVLGHQIPQTTNLLAAHLAESGLLDRVYDRNEDEKT